MAEDKLSINKLTGEVSFKLGDTPFKLHATMPRVAEYQAALKVNGFWALQELLGRADSRAIYWGLRCLCSSGNEALFDKMLMTPHIADATVAIFRALKEGLPDEDPPLAAGEPATTTTASPGRDTEKSLTGSSVGPASTGKPFET